MKNRRHENRLASTMQATGDDPTREQPAIRLLHCDFELGVAQNNKFFDPLTPQSAGHRVLVEYFSGRPRRGHPSRTIAKAAVFAIGETDGAQLVMVVLCTNGIGAFKRLPLNPHPTEPGWYATTIGLTTMRVLDAARLRRDDRWGVLRFALGAPAKSHDARVDELLGVPRAATFTKEFVLESAMNRRIEVEPGEDLPIGTVMRLRALNEGREQGREQGHRAMLRVMAADFGATPAELNVSQNTATMQEMREFVTALATKTRGRKP